MAIPVLKDNDFVSHSSVLTCYLDHMFGKDFFDNDSLKFFRKWQDFLKGMFFYLDLNFIFKDKIFYFADSTNYADLVQRSLHRWHVFFHHVVNFFCTVVDNKLID